MNFAKTLIISAVISIVVGLAMLNLPAQWFSLDHWFGSQKFGTALTTISSTDQLSNFPTTYNANIALTSNLTTTNSYTQLQSFASASSTLLSALQAWFGATATSTFGTDGALTLITPLLGGSGGTSSTTLSSNQVMLGNGSSGLKTAQGWGNSGEFFTSNGGTLAPSWQSGTVTFGSSTPAETMGVQGNAYISGTTTVTNINIASTTGLHSLGTNLQIPSGLGTFGMALPLIDLNIVSGGTISQATTTLHTKKLPSDFLKTNTALEITAMFNSSVAGSGCGYGIQVGNGGADATTTIGYAFGNQPKIINSFFLASTTNQWGGGVSGSGTPGITSSSTALSLSSPIYLAFTGAAVSANQLCFLEGYVLTRFGN